MSTAAVTPARRVASRTAWAALALFLLAFTVLEVANHGAPALVTAILFAILPDLTMLIGAREGGNGLLSPKAVPYYNFMHRPWIPLAIMVGYSFGPIDFVPLFVAGLAWLLHVAADRAFGYGLRNQDGSRRV
ncbi:DUF4260 family protein [Nonomuraea turkmeniaca]|uniref:DUF4260 family protein n=1 Tax=Nonomuraea turkmeniaca TaxID=103838 RepID=A0A5S4FJY1_9ACTN|nr:DUF4260 family protein [Nonomuraea turkmeniaca]TMR20943.1 DUF4260 family protein [Nonomuraea turkmeniaca]